MKYGHRGRSYDKIMVDLSDWKNNKILGIGVGLQGNNHIIIEIEDDSGELKLLKFDWYDTFANLYKNLAKHWENIYLAGFKLDTTAITSHTRIPLWERRVGLARILARKGLGLDLQIYFFHTFHSRYGPPTLKKEAQNN